MDAAQATQATSLLKPDKAPLQSFDIFGLSVLIKRDDLLGPINGNKARKLHSLIGLPPDRYSRIVSCGGNQSNLMYALALLAAEKKWEFRYLTPKIPRWLREGPVGNFKQAIDLGMTVEEFSGNLASCFEKYSKIPQTLFVPQGGRSPMAAEGIRGLAAEISAETNPAEIDVAVSSGTGTTAFFLARYLPEYRIATYPCVDGADYLREQMRLLGEIPPNLHLIEPDKIIQFARPDRDVLVTHWDLQEAGIEFDLIYDAVFWNYIRRRRSQNLPAWPGQKKILFVHSGGLHGNPSQLSRYMREFPEIRTSHTFFR